MKSMHGSSGSISDNDFIIIMKNIYTLTSINQASDLRESKNQVE